MVQKLTKEQKLEIQTLLKNYIAKYPSMRKAAASLRGVSVATISTITSGHLTHISDDMLRSIRSQVVAFGRTDWNVCETQTYQEITFAMKDAQQFKNVTWIVGAAGCGKTTAAHMYRAEHREVFVVDCSEDMRKGDFLRALARKIGVNTTGSMTTRDVLDFIMDEIMLMDEPLLIFDEGDKLTDNVFHYFISIYNRLQDRCGIIFLSTSYIKRRMESGLRYDRKGYQEIHSRIGRKFFDVAPTTPKDVYLICRSNGLDDETAINEVIKDAQLYDYDLRRVKKAIHVQLRRLSA